MLILRFCLLLAAAALAPSWRPLAAQVASGAPAPFDFTILTIASAPGAPDVAAVSVVVTS
jgi:hypothetical protein